jgi:TRAP-type transport system small permease protein
MQDMLDKFLKGLRAILRYFSITSMLIMLFVIFGQVITRYFFDWTPEWSEELSRFLFVWVVFLGSALIMGESGHLAVQFLPLKFKDRPFGKFLDIVINISSYIFIGILFWQGLRMTRVMTFQMSPGMDIPMSYVYAVIPVSCVLMMLFVIRDSVKIIKGLIGPKEVKN